MGMKLPGVRYTTNMRNSGGAMPFAQRGGRGVRRAAGEMNGTERKFAEYLERLKLDGRVLWYGYESATFRLADRTTYTPDFMVQLADLSLEFYEVKGTSTSKKTGKKSAFCEPQNVIKIKVAAEIFPLRFVMFWLDSSQPGGWGGKDYSDVAEPSKLQESKP